VTLWPNTLLHSIRQYSA